MGKSHATRDAESVRAELMAYGGADPWLAANIKLLLAEPPESQTPVLRLTADLANGAVRNLGLLGAFEIVVSLCRVAAKEDL